MCFPAERPTVDTWEWFEFSPHVEVELLRQDGYEQDVQLYELCLIVRPLPAFELHIRLISASFVMSSADLLMN